MDEPRFKKLRVWQESMKLTKEIYEATKDFPQNEKYGLSSQLQRAAVREEVYDLPRATCYQPRADRRFYA
ncbi:MAG: four helix bundle protein [Athalassotoga sp.]|uniref:four helix bundle protein n=1 Tax=Athalassotoga sp. TaxID=2022597 RepID=UPI003D05C7BE